MTKNNSSLNPKNGSCFYRQSQRKPTANSLFVQIRVNSWANSPSSSEFFGYGTTSPRICYTFSGWMAGWLDGWMAGWLDG